MVKQTEDEVIQHLINHLEQEGWEIIGYCKGRQRGIDIEACKNGTTLIVEAKGARASDTAPHKKREFFDSRQIKTHFGKAIVQILEKQNEFSTAQFAIAHPDDPDIRKAIGRLIPTLKKINIKHYWVANDGEVIEE